jgi:dTDP-4-dehydrorhamnose 3,5-epimerase
MKIINTKIPGLKILKSKNFYDTRGYFRETFKKKLLKKNFIFGCLSKSKKNVLRGLHLQTKFSQSKFITVLKGKIFDVIVDLRKNSKTFGKSFSITLSAENPKSIIVPRGCAHGFLSLDNENIIYYLCDNYRSKKHEIGIDWRDKDLNIKWPIKKPKISNKDKNNLSFKMYKNKFLN